MKHISEYSGYRHNRYDDYCSTWGVLMALGASPTADCFADADDGPDEEFERAWNGDDPTIGTGDNDGFRADVLANLDADLNIIRELEPGESEEIVEYWGNHPIPIRFTREDDGRLTCVFDGYGPFEVQFY